MKEERRGVADQPVHLSDRERQVLALVAEGATDNEIALRLHLSVLTVAQYVRAIRTRLDARSRAHAVALAMRMGLLPGRSSPGEDS
jgi:DNA-binding CsgD family transcriptional regulator